MNGDQRGAGIHEEDEMTRRDEMRTREVRVVEERESRVNSDCAFHREQMGEQMNNEVIFSQSPRRFSTLLPGTTTNKFYFANSI